MSTDKIKLSGARSAASDVSISSSVVVGKQVRISVPTISASDTTRENTGFLRPDNRSLTFNKPKTNSEVTVHDVAAFILQRQGEMTAMKLQRLVYYSQAWSLVWDDTPLFDEDIEAWANGPVVRSLYKRHQGLFKVSEWDGDPAKLSDNKRDSIEKVLEFYGDMSSQALSDLTHQEAPWIEAREGLSPTDRGSRIISHAAMAEYYSSLK